jgi:hypothetical protein
MGERGFAQTYADVLRRRDADRFRTDFTQIYCTDFTQKGLSHSPCIKDGIFRYRKISVPRGVLFLLLVIPILLVAH